jgi:hypothetical protein
MNRPVKYFYKKAFKRLKSIYVTKVINCRVTLVQDSDASLRDTKGVLKI